MTEVGNVQTPSVTPSREDRVTVYGLRDTRGSRAALADLFNLAQQRGADDPRLLEAVDCLARWLP